MTDQPHWGMTVPLGGVPLAEHRAVYDALAGAGFTDLWSAEVAGADAFTPLALAAAWRPDLRLGTAVTPVFTRGPGLLAMTAAALAEAAPGRFALGIGASSPVLVSDWNAVPFERAVPAHPRHAALPARRRWPGETVDEEYETFAVRRFTLERPPAVPPALLLAALRPRHAAAGRRRGRRRDPQLAGAHRRARPCWPRRAGRGRRLRGGRPHLRVPHARTSTTPVPLGRRLITAYLTVPAYAAFHRWLGRADQLDPVWRAWAAGDRKAAAAAVPDALVDELIVHGSPERCRDRVAEYAAAGVRTPVQALLPTPELTAGGAAALAALIPRLAPEIPARLSHRRA